jgi:hypothetical protein
MSGQPGRLCERMSAQSTALTFGTFYFAVEVDEPTTVGHTDFFAAVRRCLGGIEGIEELVIDLGPPSAQTESRTVTPIADPQRTYAGPLWDFETISFNLTIPQHVQEDLDERVAWRGSERFRVHLAYGWQVPLSYVEVLDGAGMQPTAAARLVYRYLKQQTDQSAERLGFGCIPPFFTHANFFLEPARMEGVGRPFWLRDYSRPAYHRYEYHYDTETVSDPATEFFGAVRYEIDLYIACRWLSELVYVHNGSSGGDDVLPYHMEGFNRRAENVQLVSVRSRSELLDNLMTPENFTVEHREPTVRFQAVIWDQFQADQPFDFICLARSPPFTPPESDPIFDAIRQQFIEET